MRKFLVTMDFVGRFEAMVEASDESEAIDEVLDNVEFDITGEYKSTDVVVLEVYPDKNDNTVVSELSDLIEE